MKKIFINKIEKVGRLAKKVGKESPDTIFAFIYYEPKAPDLIKKNQKIKQK